MSFSALDSRLVGPLFAADAMRAVFSDGSRIAAMLAAEVALAEAEARFGLADPGLAPAIRALAPADLDLDRIGRDTVDAMVPTIPFVKVVQAKLPPALARDFHRGATTQDILDTATALQMKAAFPLIAADLVAVLAGLERLAEAHARTPMVGRTYGQQAAPVTFGYEAAVWLAGIAEAAADLPRIRGRALAASLGGPVGTLAGLGDRALAVRAAFAAALDLSPPALTWHALRGRIAETGAWLATLIGTLAKFAGDVAHMASTEVGEVAEPHHPGRGGSTAMPHKRNPVSATVILAAHGAAGGLVATLLTAMNAAHQRPPGAWHAEWHALPALFGLASGALREARLLAEGLTVDPARMAHNLAATRGLLFADAAAGRLSARLGREAAHAAVERAASRVRSDADLSLRRALEEDAGLPHPLTAELDAAFDLAPAVEAAARMLEPALIEAQSARRRLV